MKYYEKEQRNKYYSKNYDEIRNKQKEYYQKNKEKILKKAKKRYKLKREKIKKYSRDYNKKNKEKINKSSKEYYISNKKIILKRIKKYQEGNPVIMEVSNISKKIKIPKNKKCQICKENEAKHKHHFNYDNPLKVNFLCRSCHKIIHIKNVF